jgi:AcrR family transcriptional regulator
MSEATEGAGRPRGRPRSGDVDSALLEAAAAEFEERGYHAMSMESIAARAGVSKVSLYRRWPSKEAVAAELLGRMGEAGVPEDRGGLEADLRALLRGAIGKAGDKTAATALMRTIGEVAWSPELLEVYRERLLGPRIGQIRALVERARTRKELKPGISTDLACGVIAGPLLLYYLAQLTEAEIDLPANLPDAMAKAILGGIAR